VPMVANVVASANLGGADESRPSTTEGVVIGTMRTILGGVLERIPRPTPAMAVALLALLIAASGAAVAAIPSDDGTITACRDNRTGTLRVINAEGGQTCTSKETQLAWKDGITGTVADSELLDGQDSSAFLGAEQKAADSEKLDGFDSTDFAKAYKRTVVVSPVGTAAQNGQALLDAHSGITDASASKPYLIHIEPATYDIGLSPLTMKEWVDIQGSGELNTVINSGRATGNCSDAAVMGADNAEIRFLTVRNSGQGTACRSAIASVDASPRLTHVTAEVTGDSSDNVGVNLVRSNATMIDVTATASGAPMRNIGVRSILSSPTIRHSKFSGSTASLQQNGLSSTPVKVALTQFVGPVATLSGTVQCFNSYNENMAAVC